MRVHRPGDWDLHVRRHPRADPRVGITHEGVHGKALDIVLDGGDGRNEGGSGWRLNSMALFGSPPFIDNANGNPLLEEYNRTGVVPAALAPVIESVRRKMQPQALGDNPGLPGTSQAPRVSPTLAPPGTPPPALTGDVPRGTSQPLSAGSPDASAPMAGPNPSPAKAEFNRLTHVLTPEEKAGGMAHTTADTGTAGENQIHNPWARNSLKVLDAIGSAFFPALTAGLPGTQLHHNLLVNQARGNVNEEQSVANDEAKRGHLEEETNELNPAQAEEARARAAALRNPQDKSKPDVHAMYAAAVADAQKRGMNPADDPKVQETLAAITALNKEPAPAKPDLHVALADAVTDAQKRGVDPSGDAKVQQILKVLTSEHPPTEHTANAEEQFVDEYRKSHSGSTIAQAQRAYKQNEQLPTQRDPDVALDREGTRFSKSPEKSVADANAQLEKIADARAMINGSTEAQALGIPKVLTALVSGAGTGVRITQPELNAIGGARGIGGDVQGFVNSLSGKGKLTAIQQEQLTDLLDGVHERILQKQAIANDALDKINGARSREEIIQADKAARKSIADLEKSGGAQNAGAGKVRVQVPGHDAGEIDASQKDAFLKRYPNAKVLGK